MPIYFLLVFFLFSCSKTTAIKSENKIKLTKLHFKALKNWSNDNHYQAFEAFIKSCQKIKRLNKDKLLKNNNIAGKAADWQAVCRLALTKKIVNDNHAREFFENNFYPYSVEHNGKLNGLFTGYHEPELKGSRIKTSKFIHPIYKVPDNLALINKTLSRKAINNGIIANKGFELLYVEDEVELFFMHIQGSGKIQLANNQIVRVGYANQNGHPYFGISNHLIKEYNIDRKTISGDFIKNWLKKNKQKAKQVMDLNPSYVFFRELTGEGPVGGQNVVLTPQRSLAIDHNHLPYGVLLWVETEFVDHLDSKIKPFNKLMVAQDTGGAIRGAIRGDIFFGSDQAAARLAAHQKYMGKYYLILPKTVKK